MCAEENDGRKWFVLYTKPRHEFKAAAQLDEVRIENYLPVMKTIRQWSDRKKKVTIPLFSGYIFVRVNEKERFTALERDAVLSTITFNGKPAAVPDKQIEDLKTILKNETQVSVSDKFKVGTQVKITAGPFEGVEGYVFESTNNEKMIGITIGLLKRTVSVKLPVASITKVIGK